MKREDPFRSGFVRRLYVAKHKSGAKGSVESNGRKTGGEAMMLNGVDTVFQDGKYWEIINFAAKRYGVSGKTIQEHLGKELFRAEDPRTGIMMICGALPENVVKQKRKEDYRIGSKEWLLWFCLFLFFLVFGMVAWAVTRNFLVLGVFVGISVALACLKPVVGNEKERKSLWKSFWESIPACDDGGVFGWSVPSSAAKADIDWMFGRDK